MEYKVNGYCDDGDFSETIEGQPAIEDGALVFWEFPDGNEIMVKAFAEGHWDTCEKVK